jgi:class 3 adenylate cyclase
MKSITSTAPDRSKLTFHIAEAVYALIVLAWYIVPLISPSLGGFNPITLASALFGSPPTEAGAWLLVTILAYAVPVICVWKLASFFLEKIVPFLADPDLFLPILFNLLSSGIVVALAVLHLVNQAHSAKYFAALPPLTYAVAAISIGYNGFFIIMLIASNSRRDESYREYLEFRKTSEEGSNRSVLAAVQRQGIQRKLILTFVPLILVIIFVLAFFLLRDFSRTILAAVYANGEGLADRTASVVKANPGDKDRISLDDYFSAESKKNASTAGQASAFRYNTLSYYRPVKTGGFVVWASTNKQLINTTQPKDLVLKEIISRYNPSAESYEFLAPVTLSGMTIGYVQVDYARDVIYEPYFRTQVKVFVIAALFMYASIFLTYLFGRNIVFPILFLRMSVNSIADKLSSMIKGKLRFSSELLQYNDRVHTRDEIKLLSGEVNHMTTVIRGVIPYISTSTLKHAERDTPTTERRTLTFLFTDIRGFTSMSETMSPDKVVEMLNHYLDLQSGIIHANSGDVDKFVGDEVMAMFEGPKKDYNACKAAVEIRKAMAQEKELAKAANKQFVSIGIGINAGPVVHGSMGAKDRMDFTSIGDTVNLAARLEGTNKEYGTKSLITAAVYDKVKDTFLCREVDLVTVKGKTQPVRIYELLQETKSASEKLEKMKSVFEESLGFYRKQKWDAASKGFAALAKEFKDETSEVFLGRVAEFRENPPPKDWDGVFHRTSK